MYMNACILILEGVLVLLYVLIDSTSIIMTKIPNGYQMQWLLLAEFLVSLAHMVYYLFLRCLTDFEKLDTYQQCNFVLMIASLVLNSLMFMYTMLLTETMMEKCKGGPYKNSCKYSGIPYRSVWSWFLTLTMVNL